MNTSIFMYLNAYKHKKINLNIVTCIQYIYMLQSIRPKTILQLLSLATITINLSMNKSTKYKQQNKV
jgi:hypothetical protein